VEEEYAGSGFAVVARYGCLGQEYQGFGRDVGWDELERRASLAAALRRAPGWRFEPAI
jgi:hypothetical protein